MDYVLSAGESNQDRWIKFLKKVKIISLDTLETNAPILFVSKKDYEFLIENNLIIKTKEQEG